MSNEEKSKYKVDAAGEIDYEQSVQEEINQLDFEQIERGRRFVRNIKKGIWPTDEDIEMQKQMSKQISIITQAYNRLVKRNKIDNSTNSEFAELLKKVKEQKSSVGDIVRKID